MKVRRNQTHKFDLRLSSAAKERKPSVSEQKPLYKHAAFGGGSPHHSLSVPNRELDVKH